MLDLAELDSAKKKLETKKPKRRIDHAAHPPEGEEADHLFTRILTGQDLFENRLSACEIVACGFVVFLLRGGMEVRFDIS